MSEPISICREMPDGSILEVNSRDDGGLIIETYYMVGKEKKILCKKNISADELFGNCSPYDPYPLRRK